MSQSLDSLDVKLLRMLSDNARKPYLEIARETGVSGAAIHQRMAKLQALGIVKGTETIIDPAAIGFTTCAYLGVILNDLSQLSDVAEKLKCIPEVVECHMTTGHYDLMLKVYGKNNEHLLSIIQEKFHPLNIGRTEALISFKEIFNRQLPIVDEAATR